MIGKFCNLLRLHQIIQGLMCNVAKMNASPTTRLVLIDSWNKWDEDTQMESAVSYGDLYLNITKQQFKKP